MPKGRGSGPEPYLGEELTGEHEIAEGGEELTGAPAVRAVPEKDSFHGGIGPSRSACVRVCVCVCVCIM